MSAASGEFVHAGVQQAVLRSGFTFGSLPALECTCKSWRSTLELDGALREVLRCVFPAWNFDAIPSPALYRIYSKFKASCLQFANVGRPAAVFVREMIWDSDEDSDGSDACCYHYVQLSDDHECHFEDLDSLERFVLALDSFRFSRQLRPLMRSQLLLCSVRWDKGFRGDAVDFFDICPTSSSCIFFSEDTSVRFSFQLCIWLRPSQDSLSRRVCLKINRLPVDAQTHRRNYKFIQCPDGWMSTLMKDCPDSTTHISVVNCTLQFLDPYIPQAIEVGPVGCFSQGNCVDKRRHECFVAPLFSDESATEQKGAQAILRAIRLQRPIRFMLCVWQECGRIGDR